MQNNQTPYIVLEGISKSFGGVQALENIDLSIRPGQIHAVLGENGAGKSTLMKIIAGALQPDSGVMSVGGEEVQYTTPRDAVDRGICIVYQEPTFFSELTVVENFFVGDLLQNKINVVDWEKMADATEKALVQIGLSKDISGTKMSELSIGNQQLVMIARGINKNAKILILDEPTSILSQSETDLLFEKLQNLKEKGVGILYISHRLQEIFKIADNVTVLRDGLLVDQYDIQDATETKLIESMSGRKRITENVYEERLIEDQEPVLEVKNLTRFGDYKDVSFSVKAGEIIGLYGLVGAGRTELALTIFGERAADSGEIIFEGEPFSPTDSAQAINKGIIYIPEDRQTMGLFQKHSIGWNLTAGLLEKVTEIMGYTSSKKENKIQNEQIEQLNIKLNSLDDLITSLSGGNQQKVVLGRGIKHQPKVLILDEPTRGIDVGTKTEVHRLVMSLAKQGIAIIFISSELPEVLEIADKFLILNDGFQVGIVPRAEVTEQKVLRMALGTRAE
jgi:ABC-type sugar transport system ATPase subunit